MTQASHDALRYYHNLLQMHSMGFTVNFAIKLQKLLTMHAQTSLGWLQAKVDQKCQPKQARNSSESGTDKENMLGSLGSNKSHNNSLGVHTVYL